MNAISIGAVGAAVIAGLVSLLGLIIAKEQKVSEFRQAWIDELRKCFVAYIVNINAISDALRLSKSGNKLDKATLIPNYKALNEASLGIKLRINSEEETAKALLAAMSKFEEVASEDDALTPDNIKNVERDFLSSSTSLLKFEWKRVKRGEKIFVWTKNLVILALAVMTGFLIYAGFFDGTTVSELPAGLDNSYPVEKGNDPQTDDWRRLPCCIGPHELQATK